MNNPLFEIIKEQIQNNDIVLYMKGTTDFPACGFSAKVVSILNIYGISFLDINILENLELRQSIKQYSDWPTIPQLYIKGEFIGGCDIVTEMYQTGELQELLVAKGLLEF